MRTGWLTAVEFTLRLREFGLFFAGLPCCSFIWLNRSTSMRSADVPFGDQLKLYIQQANVLLDNWISKYSFFNTNGHVICIACISKLHLSARMCVCVCHHCRFYQGLPLAHCCFVPFAQSDLCTGKSSSQLLQLLSTFHT